jgi:ribosomal protein S18 acetylase RimI-like enzyme
MMIGFRSPSCSRRRSHGVGSALVAAAIEWARERGLHKRSLSVFPQSAAAIALYRKFGPRNSCEKRS